MALIVSSSSPNDISEWPKASSGHTSLQAGREEGGEGGEEGEGGEGRRKGREGDKRRGGGKEGEGGKVERREEERGRGRDEDIHIVIVQR